MEDFKWATFQRSDTTHLGIPIPNSLEFHDFTDTVVRVDASSNDSTINMAFDFPIDKVSVKLGQNKLLTVSACGVVDSRSVKVTKRGVINGSMALKEYSVSGNTINVKLTDTCDKNVKSDDVYLVAGEASDLSLDIDEMLQDLVANPTVIDYPLFTHYLAYSVPRLTHLTRKLSELALQNLEKPTSQLDLEHWNVAFTERPDCDVDIYAEGEAPTDIDNLVEDLKEIKANKSKELNTTEQKIKDTVKRIIDYEPAPQSLKEIAKLIEQLCLKNK